MVDNEDLPITQSPIRVETVNKSLQNISANKASNEEINNMLSAFKHDQDTSMTEHSTIAMGAAAYGINDRLLYRPIRTANAHKR